MCYELVVFSDIDISLNVVWYLVYNEHTAHCTTQMTEKQIITLFHLVLQVYCSSSLKEDLHNPVMTVPACSMQRTVSILCAHVCVCVVWVVLYVRECTFMFVCYMYMVCGCAYMCISVCHCVSALRMVDTSLQVYLITRVQNNVHTVLEIAGYFSCYMLQLTQCDVVI